MHYVYSSIQIYGPYYTCEVFLFQIRQYKRLDDGSVNIVTRGQQRFRLRRSWIDVEGAVRIMFTLVCSTMLYTCFHDD